MDFEIVRSEYIYDEHRNDIEIYYPQLSGLADSAKEERINALIEDNVKKIIVIIEDVLADYNEYSISNESAKHILDAEFLKKLE